ncbi:MAG TPA: GIY-YIG nuclease family protein [Ktedonobacterales bacterium]|nr:GIY-YIG nuclease family protein [Ktedonobacterales bacterium]
MAVVTDLSDVPAVPAVYALYGGRGAARSVAYVGVAERLKQRIRQHLVSRDSSVVTGASVVRLNPGLITEVAWWTSSAFADRAHLEAAEMVAFDALQPTLRSRGAGQVEARQLYQDERFAAEMRALFAAEPAGRLTILALADALERIADLERRVAALEARLETRLRER